MLLPVHLTKNFTSYRIETSSASSSIPPHRCRLPRLDPLRASAAESARRAARYPSFSLRVCLHVVVVLSVHEVTERNSSATSGMRLPTHHMHFIYHVYHVRHPVAMIGRDIHDDMYQHQYISPRISRLTA